MVWRLSSCALPIACLFRLNSGNIKYNGLVMQISKKYKIVYINNGHSFYININVKKLKSLIDDL